MRSLFNVPRLFDQNAANTGELHDAAEAPFSQRTR